MKLRRKPVSTFRNGLYIVGRLCGAIAKHHSQLAHGAIDGVVEVDDLAVGPKLVPDFFPGDHGSAAFDQNGQQPGDLIRNADRLSVPAKLSGTAVEDKDRKSIDST